MAEPNHTVPVELYRPIIECITARGDLFRLLLVSRDVNKEAERALYRTVIPHGSSSHKLQLLMATLASNPRIASHCHRLTLRGLDATSVMLHRDAIHKALLALPNLIDLDLFIDFTLIEGCTFRLRKLRAERLLDLPDDHLALEGQEDIVDLDVRGMGNIRIDHERLPNLTIFAADYFNIIVTKCPVRALYCFSMFEAMSLPALEHVKSLRAQWNVADKLTPLTMGFPNLRYLRLRLQFLDNHAVVNVLQNLVKDIEPLEHLHLLRAFLGRPPKPDPALSAIEGLFELNLNFRELVLQEQSARKWSRSNPEVAEEWEVDENLWKDSRWV